MVGHVAGTGRKQIQGFDGDMMNRDVFEDLGVDYRIRFFFLRNIMKWIGLI